MNALVLTAVAVVGMVVLVCLAVLWWCLRSANANRRARFEIQLAADDPDALAEEIEDYLRRQRKDDHGGRTV